MSDQVVIVIVGAIQAVILAVVGGALAVIMERTRTQGEAIAKQKDSIEEIHKATNSMKDQLVEVTRTESRAAGIKEEKERHEAGIKQDEAITESVQGAVEKINKDGV